MSYFNMHPLLDSSLLSEASCQLFTELDVQLPGSDFLLPSLDEYLVKPTTTSPQESKQQPESNFFDLDLDLADEYKGFEEPCIQQSEYLFEFGVDDLPASPELFSCDLIENQVVCQTTQDETPLIAPEASLCDFDAEWLLHQVTSFPNVSPEEVDSLLSDSYDSLSSSEDSLSLASSGFKDETSSGLALSPCGEVPAESFQLPPSSVSVLVSRSPLVENGSLVANCSVQALGSVGWLDGNLVGNSLPVFGRVLTIEDALVDITNSQTTSLASSVGSSGTMGEPVYKSSVACTPVATPRFEPYPSPGVKPERRERKREQNKTAALKYRQKKRSEQDVHLSECEQLEKRNVELKSRADELTREINYLKGLISEIYSSQAE